MKKCFIFLFEFFTVTEEDQEAEIVVGVTEVMEEGVLAEARLEPIYESLAGILVALNHLKRIFMFPTPQYQRDHIIKLTTGEKIKKLL